MNLIEEAEEIIANAKAAYKRGEITLEQLLAVTRIPMKDMFLTLYAHGEQYLAFRSDIHVPHFDTPPQEAQ